MRIFKSKSRACITLTCLQRRPPVPSNPLAQSNPPTESSTQECCPSYRTFPLYHLEYVSCTVTTVRSMRKNKAYSLKNLSKRSCSNAFLGHLQDLGRHSAAVLQRCLAVRCQRTLLVTPHSLTSSAALQCPSPLIFPLAHTLIIHLFLPTQLTWIDILLKSMSFYPLLHLHSPGTHREPLFRSFSSVFSPWR